MRNSYTSLKLNYKLTPQIRNSNNNKNLDALIVVTQKNYYK